jgi:zinc protease
VEDWIRERFATLPNPDAPLDRPTLDVPDYGGTAARVIGDPEISYTEAYVVYRLPAQETRTTADYRTNLADSLVATMLNQRYTEITRQESPPFLAAATGSGEYVRPVQIASLYVQTEEGQAETGLQAALAEIERARQHGFTEAELNRARTDMLRQFQSSYDERNNLDSSMLAQGYLQNFLTGAIPTSVTDDFALAQELLPTITLADVNDRMEALYGRDNRAVIVVAPEKEDAALPDETALVDLLNDVAATEFAPYEAAEVTGELMAAAPAPAAITAEETLPDLGITRIELANGVQVFFKPTEFKDDEIIFSSFSPGGDSLVADEDVPAAAFGSYLVTQSGLAEFSQTDLEKLLTGKAVSVAPYVDELGEGFSGSASPQDLETLFQLIYLYATAPRMDPNAFALLQRQVDDYLKNRTLDPSAALEDKYNEIFCGEDPRCNFITLYERVKEVDPQQALALYEERFADLDDSVFVFVGALDIDEAKALAQTYLGALPAAGGEETWRNVRPPHPEGVIAETVNAGIEPRSEVQIYFHGPFTPTVESRVTLQAMTRVLDIMVREDLREARGGIYGASVSSTAEPFPAGEYQTRISFTAEPTRVVELTDAVFAEIKNLRDNGPSETNFTKARAQLRSQHEENLQDNNAWLTWINRFVVDTEGPLTDIERIDEVIDAVTPAAIQALAQEVLPDARHVTLVLHPEDFQQ